MPHGLSPGPLVAAAAALVLAAAPSPSAAFSLSKDPESPASRVSINVTNDFRFKYYLLPELPEGDPLFYALDTTDVPVLLDRLTVSGGTRWLTAGVQVDGMLAFPGADRSLVVGEAPPGEGRPQGWVTPEKFYVQLRHRVVQGEVGDTYAVLGRGLAMAFIKTPAIDVDTSVRGGQVRVTTDPFDLTLIGGVTNPQDISLENVNTNLQAIPGDLAVGGQASIRPVDGLTLSAIGSHFRVHGTFADPHEQGFTPLGTAVGGSVAGLAFDGNLDLYGEAVGYLYSGALKEADPELQEGAAYAVYASAMALLGKVTLLGEFKRYRHAQELGPTSGTAYLAYTRPPTLELEDMVTEDASFTVGSDDLWGWHLRAATAAGDGTLINLNVAQFIDRDVDPGQRDNEVVVHGYGGFERYFSSGHHLIFTAGYRRDIAVAREFEPGDHPHQDLWHGDLSYALVLGRGHVLEGRTRFQRFATYFEDPFSWVNADTTLSWVFRGRYFLAGTLGYTSDPSIQNLALGGIRGNLLHSDPDEGNEKSLYGAIEVIARPDDAVQLKAFAGSTRGGIVCSGGQCRLLPGFQGFRFETSVSF
ncbi:hypothetical protein L6R50_17925 [Myxococcota bacterium]|nr:hypothetical protein [Myxococcota bacterium]